MTLPNSLIQQRIQRRVVPFVRATSDEKWRAACRKAAGSGSTQETRGLTAHGSPKTFQTSSCEVSVHPNSVKHRSVQVATIYSFGTTKVQVLDEFTPVWNGRLDRES